MIGFQGSLNAQMLKEHSGGSGIFAEHQIGAPKEF